MPGPANVNRDQILCKLRYQLSHQQTLEAMQLILDRRGRKARAGMAAALWVLAGAFFILYLRDTAAAYRAALALLCLVCGAAVFCYPAAAARRSADQISRRKGWYELRFRRDGTILLPSGEAVPLSGDRGCRGFWTPRVIALRPDREHTFCIPLEAVPTGIREELYALLERSMRHFQMM